MFYEISRPKVKPHADSVSPLKVDHFLFSKAGSTDDRFPRSGTEFFSNSDGSGKRPEIVEFRAACRIESECVGQES
jgi:hypothetical protein